METDGCSAAGFSNEFTVFEMGCMDGGRDWVCRLQREIKAGKDDNLGLLSSMQPPTPTPGANPRQEVWASCQVPERKTGSGLVATLTVEQDNRFSPMLLLALAEKSPAGVPVAWGWGKDGGFPPGSCLEFISWETAWGGGRLKTAHLPKGAHPLNQDSIILKETSDGWQAPSILSSNSE